MAQVADRSVLGVVDAEVGVRRTEGHGDVTHDRHHARHRLTFVDRLGEQCRVVGRPLKSVDGVDIARQGQLAGWMRKILCCKQLQLFGVGRVVGHQGEVAPVVHDELTGGELQDRRVPFGVLDGEVHRRLEPVGTHHDELDSVHQVQRLGHGGGLIEQVLHPHSDVQSRNLRLASTHVGRLQIQAVGGETAFVEAVDGADAVDAGRQAGVGAGPAQRVLGHDDLTQHHSAVACPAPREGDDQRFRRFGPIHRPTSRGRRCHWYSTRLGCT